jgi:DNA repair exonuclease SbcCD ATPase subunit
MERFGWQKRHILVDRVQDARDEQEAAKKQFQTTLERFIEVTQADVRQLESRYRRLQADFNRSEARAEDVRKRIGSIETVAADLFKEWRAELAQYESAELRRSSEQKLRETQQRYEQFIDAMKRAAAKMDPVLAAFRDQVLYLKHNLNAAAIAALETTTMNLEQDVSALIREMEASIAEANAFIQEMRQQQGG